MGQLDDLFDDRSDEGRQISAVTRRDILDYIPVGIGSWWGRLDESAFLERLYDLEPLPSTDSRVESADGDIFQHRVRDNDWDDDWIFHDSRFRLANGPDEILLGFLAQMVHPVVQSDTERAAEIVAELNRLLAPDGWMLRLRSQISGRPVHAPARTGTGTAVVVAFAHDIAVRVDAGYISQQVTPAQQLRGLRDHVTRLRRFARSRSSSSFARSSGGRDASRVTAGSRYGTASSWNAGSNPVWALGYRVGEPVWLIHAVPDVTSLPRAGTR